MNKVILALALLVAIGCSPSKESVTIIKGNPGASGLGGTNGHDGINGTSCSVSDYYGEPLFTSLGLEEPMLSGTPTPTPTPLVKLGALISCTDGSFSYILNGTQGAQGLQGIPGVVGQTGEPGVAGDEGKSCSVSRGSHHGDDDHENEHSQNNYVTISCPGSEDVFVYDGTDGENGATGPQGPIGPSITGLPGQNGTPGISPTCTTSLVATNFTFNDYTVLPVTGVAPASAYCTKGGATHTTTASNCNQWNDNGHGGYTNDWTFHAAVAGVTAVTGEFTVRTITINIPTVTCSTSTPN